MSELNLRRRCRMELLRSQTKTDEAHALRVSQARRQAEGFYRNDPAPSPERTGDRGGRVRKDVLIAGTVIVVITWATIWLLIGAQVFAP